MKAVITGDIIQSSRMGIVQREWMFKNISKSLKLLEKDYGIQTELFRGDSFQCLVHNVVDTLSVALIIKMQIRSMNPSEVYEVEKRKNPGKKVARVLTDFIIDARIAIGIGEVDVTSKKLAASSGAAFYFSGHLLDSMKNTKQSFGIRTDDVFNDELETEAALLDAIISRTTALQCQVIYLKLLSYTETEIARKLKIMQSAINQRSTSGNWNAINTMVKRFEAIYSND